jgi:pimeloyl-ACP methyl ester carboxylesterase
VRLFAKVKKAFSVAHYLELPGVGHMPRMESPPAVAEALRAFLATQ